MELCILTDEPKPDLIQQEIQGGFQFSNLCSSNKTEGKDLFSFPGAGHGAGWNEAAKKKESRCVKDKTWSAEQILNYFLQKF